MQAIRQLFEQAPESIPVPERWQKRRLEVILLAQEEESVSIGVIPSSTDLPAVDEPLDWPAGYFEQTFGSIPDFPERECQGVEEQRAGTCL